MCQYTAKDLHLINPRQQVNTASKVRMANKLTEKHPMQLRHQKSIYIIKFNL